MWDARRYAYLLLSSRSFTVSALSSEMVAYPAVYPNKQETHSTWSAGRGGRGPARYGRCSPYARSIASARHRGQPRPVQHLPRDGGGAALVPPVPRRRNADDAAPRPAGRAPRPRTRSATLMSPDSSRFWKVRAIPRRATRCAGAAGDVTIVEADASREGFAASAQQVASRSRRRQRRPRLPPRHALIRLFCRTAHEVSTLRVGVQGGRRARAR